MSKEKIETVEVSLKLPKAVVDFIKAVDKPESLEKYLEHLIVENTQSYTELLESTSGLIMEKFELTPVFKEYGVLPSYRDKEAEKHE